MGTTRKRIGLAISGLYGGYFHAIWEGALQAARQTDAHLAVFVGGEVDSPRGYDSQRTAIYELACPDSIDAAVVMTDVIGKYANTETVEAIVRRMAIPVVGIGASVSGIPSVSTDNYQGMMGLVSHLIEKHGKRRIAFIAGPRVSAEANARFNAYRRTLGEHGIELDEDLIVNGFFDAASGTSAIRVLVDQRHASFDALVAANDTMALSAMALLELHGTRVPEDVVVVGFDDVEESIHASPPLTTVRQPSFELGRRAVLLAARLASGEEKPESITLDAVLAVRNSCGCEMWTDAAHADSPPAIGEARQRIAFELSRPSLHSVGEEPARRLVDSFAVDLADPARGEFAATLRGILQGRFVSGPRAVALSDGLALLRRTTYASVSPENLARVREIWKNARASLVVLDQRVRTHDRTERSRDEQLRHIGWELVSTTSLVEVGSIAERLLPEVGVSGFCVCLYDHPRPGADARVAFGCTASGKIEIGHEPFPSQQLLPATAWQREQRTSYVVHPLFVKRRQLGYVVFETGPIDGGVYETLARHLSVAVSNAQLIMP